MLQVQTIVYLFAFINFTDLAHSSFLESFSYIMLALQVLCNCIVRNISPGSMGIVTPRVST